MNRTLDVASSFAASVARLGAGISVGTPGPRPEQPLVLYEFESCPYCRKVREALTILDLDAQIRPCPKGGTRFREEVIAKGGKAQFPYLVDVNAGIAIYESDDIVRHLFERYGNGRVSALLAPGMLAAITGTLASGLRLGSGVHARKSRLPAKPLELWSFEGSPFCRIVREALCELELPYLLHNVGKGSAKREGFVASSGRMMVPWLVDPNHGVTMFESADIVRYLEQTWALL